MIGIDVPGVDGRGGGAAGPSHRIPAWRIAAGLAVLTGIIWIGALLVPVYLHNLALEKYLRDAQPVSEEVLRQEILEKGRSLGLDVVPEHLQIRRSPLVGNMGVRSDVRYVVRVTLPLYTVDLHFASNTSAGVK